MIHVNNPGGKQLTIQEIDGSPSGKFKVLKVTNGTLTDNGDGSATLVVTGGTGAPSTASYITIANDATLSGERALTGGSAIALVDGGANSTITVNFRGGINPSGNLSGTWTTPTVKDLTIVAQQQGDLLYYNGTNWVRIDLGTSRSLLAVNDGGTAPVWVANRSGAPTAGTYIVQSLNGTLTNERVLTAGSAVALVDGGANGNMTINFAGGTIPVGDLGGVWSTPRVLNMRASSAPIADHTGNGIKMLDVVGEGVDIGNVLRIKADGKYGKADADAAASMPAVVLTTATLAANATGELLHQGYFRDDTWAWTAGALLYASSVAGTMTHTVPSNAGQQVQVLGYAVTTKIVYFSPSLVLVERV